MFNNAKHISTINYLKWARWRFYHNSRSPVLNIIENFQKSSSCEMARKLLQEKWMKIKFIEKSLSWLHAVILNKCSNTKVKLKCKKWSLLNIKEINNHISRNGNSVPLTYVHVHCLCQGMMTMTMERSTSYWNEIWRSMLKLWPVTPKRQHWECILLSGDSFGIQKR